MLSKHSFIVFHLTLLGSIPACLFNNLNFYPMEIENSSLFIILSVLASLLCVQWLSHAISQCAMCNGYLTAVLMCFTLIKHERKHIFIFLGHLNIFFYEGSV